MKKLIDDDGREYELDDNGKCRFVRVPLSLSDARPDRYTQDHAASLRQYASLGAKAGRPGVAMLSDAQRAASGQQYAHYKATLSTAWQKAAPLPPTTPTRDARPPSSGPRPASSQQAYQAHVERLQNAWRAR